MQKAQPVSEGYSFRRANVKQVLLMNLPEALTYTLGTLIMFSLGLAFGLLYIVFFITQLVLFMRFVCIHCAAYGTPGCRSGYGRVAARFFVRGRLDDFRHMFKKFIPFLALVWFIPLLVGFWVLYSDFTFPYLFLLIAFLITGFILLPIFHKRYECKKCPNKENCPWVR